LAAGLLGYAALSQLVRALGWTAARTRLLIAYLALPTMQTLMEHPTHT
jgi:hypothetical protein